MRTTMTAFVYSIAKYEAFVWVNSSRVSRMDSQLNNAMRISSDTAKSTHIPWLSILANIMQPYVRRKGAFVETVRSRLKRRRSLMIQMFEEMLKIRMKSRKTPSMHNFAAV